MGDIASNLYSSEIEAESLRDPNSSPDGETTKAIDNRVYDEEKGYYVDVERRLNPDGSERLSAYNVKDSDVTDPAQETNLQRKEEEKE